MRGHHRFDDHIVQIGLAGLQADILFDHQFQLAHFRLLFLELFLGDDLLNLELFNGAQKVVAAAARGLCRGRIAEMVWVGDPAALFLVRDPRDVVVSYFYQRVKREDRPADLPTELGPFVRHPDFGVDRILRFLAACQHAVDNDPGPSLVLSYEALHADAAGSLGRVLTFFGVDGVPREALDAAAAEVGVDYIGGYSALVEKGMTPAEASGSRPSSQLGCQMDNLVLWRPSSAARRHLS